ncbi:EamA family transporter [Curvivirga sp.]|uniref:EamA family transporter n=1 Tax=Curvivirga sp. TaxID=2856848 RepID=UPI003B58BE26
MTNVNLSNANIGATILIVFSAFFFSLNTPFAPLFFDAGGNAATLNFIRMFSSSILSVGVLLLFRDKLDLSLKTLKISAFIGLLVMGQGLCYLASVRYIPVGLAALIFFTWPMTVAILAPFFGEKAVSPKGFLFFIGGFLGIALSLGPSFDSLDWRGVSLAFAGGSLIAAMMISIRRAVIKTSPLSLAVTNNFFASLSLLTIMPFIGGWSLPNTYDGLLPVVIVSAVFFAAVLCQNIGLRRVNAQSAAIIFKLEPIFSIFAAFVLLNERLEILQYFGAFIVFLSLCGYQIYERKKAS